MDCFYSPFLKNDVVCVHVRSLFILFLCVWFKLCWWSNSARVYVQCIRMYETRWDSFLEKKIDNEWKRNFVAHLSCKIRYKLCTFVNSTTVSSSSSPSHTHRHLHRSFLACNWSFTDRSTFLYLYLLSSFSRSLSLSPFRSFSIYFVHTYSSMHIMYNQPPPPFGFHSMYTVYICIPFFSVRWNYTRKL